MRKAAIRIWFYTLIILFAQFIITGCSAVKPTGGPDAIFIPPSLSVTATSAPYNTSVVGEVDSSAPKTDCSNTLAYLNDLTVTDGSTFFPGEIIDKRWLVENQGTCNWDARYTLRFIGGQPMDASAEQSLVPALAGTQVTIRILFIAPNEPGKYRSAWQAYTGDSIPFGDPFYTEIEVLPEVSS